MQLITLAAAIFCLAIGFCVLLANPRRSSNRAFAMFSLILTSWLACVFGAMVAGSFREQGRYADLEFWFRANAVVASYAPWGIWLLNKAITSSKRSKNGAFQSSLPILGIGVILAVICFSDSFIFPGSDSILHRGFAYFVHTSTGEDK